MTKYPGGHLPVLPQYRHDESRNIFKFDSVSIFYHVVSCQTINPINQRAPFIYIAVSRLERNGT